MTNALKSTLILTIASFALVLGFAITSTLNVSAQEEAEQQVEVTTTEVTEDTQEGQDQGPTGTYDFVAQPGDSYSQMARKATQIYGIESQTNLSEAQIMFVETNLTQKAGSPLLNLDEAVSIQKADVSEWAEKAKSLTDEEIAAWQYYADMADFNTNSVGEAS